MHPTGFEPVTFHWKTDYESGAFDHSATDAYKLESMELVGIEPTSTQLTIVYSFTSLALFNI